MPEAAAMLDQKQGLAFAKGQGQAGEISGQDSLYSLLFIPVLLNKPLPQLRSHPGQVFQSQMECH